MNTTAVILLAGSSTRFASSSPKQFYEVNGKPLAFYSIEPFVNAKAIDSILIVTKKEFIDKLTNLVASFSKPISFVIGGNTRYESVENAINFLKKTISREDKILIHDGARLFVEEKQINDLLASLDSYDAATLAIPVEDTIGEVSNGELRLVPDRNKLMRMQTPQAFKLKTLELIHKNADKNVTDDAQLCLSNGKKVAILLGNKKLNKVTTIEDIDNIKAILNK